MSGLRVIAGSARGRRLNAVPGEATRPITDRAKEALFNIIGADIQGASLLDLFAGTGCVGIEALSRGAAFVRFTDIQHQAIKTIHANLRLTRLESGAEVLRLDAFSLLERTPDRTFDYIFIAPPQYKGLWRKTLEKLDANPGWLTPDAWVIVQIHPIEFEPLPLVHLAEFDRRKYGSTLFIFYERSAPSISPDGPPEQDEQ